MGKFADSRILMGTLIVTLLALAYLGLAPTNDASFSCQTLPVVRMVNPEAEAAPPGFFDSGTQCNADAQGRARSMGLVLMCRLFFPDIGHQRPGHSPQSLSDYVLERYP